MRILVITDNEFIYSRFLDLLKKLNLAKSQFDFRYSYFNQIFSEKYKDHDDFKPVNVSEELQELCTKYNLIISLHCQQIFPKELVDRVRCINVHPGYNPYNRGWYPHVFSIINSLPAGVTIHEMDEKIDHGAIIVQRQVEICSWDTSESVYNKIIETEIDLLEEYLVRIIDGNYKTLKLEHRGNLNTKNDYKKLCEIKLDQQIKAGDFINLLRALSHGDYKNAFFIDKDGHKVWIKIALEKDE